jgi:1-deoxy-D-xylulose-5-phosphate synthase
VLPDAFLDHDSPARMYAKAGLDAQAIVAKVFDVLGGRESRPSRAKA